MVAEENSATRLLRNTKSHYLTQSRGEQYTSVYSAAVSVTNDVLLTGALDGEMRAFQTSDVQELTRFDSDIEFVAVAGNPGDGGTIDSGGPVPLADTVLLNSGYNTSAQSTPTKPDQ